MLYYPARKLLQLAWIGRRNPETFNRNICFSISAASGPNRCQQKPVQATAAIMETLPGEPLPDMPRKGQDSFKTLSMQCWDMLQHSSSCKCQTGAAAVDLAVGLQTSHPLAAGVL
jgi:hypothetical protein